MPVFRDYEDLLKELNAAEAEYLVVGAHAVAFHAEPRYTKDLDLWVRSTLTNGKKVHSALKRFGAPLQGIDAKDFATSGLVYQIGVEPVRVDILTSVKGLDFKAAFRRRVKTKYGAVSIPVLSIEDLIASKEAAGRPQDLLDAETLRRKLSRGR